MRIPHPTAALFAAFTLAGSVSATPRANQGPASAAASSQELLDRLARAEFLAGLTEVTGPGLIVTLRHSPRSIQGVDRDELLIHDQDLNGVLNALRAAGAEALAVSGENQSVPERILVTSAATAQDDGVQINGKKLVPPYRILAVGAGDAMRAALFRPGGVVKKAGLDALRMIDLETASNLVIPASRNTAEPKFARAATPGTRTTSGTDAGAPSNPTPPTAAPSPAGSNVTPSPKPLFPQPSTPPAPSISDPAAAPREITRSGPAGTSILPMPNRIIAVVPRGRGPAAPASPKLLPAPVDGMPETKEAKLGTPAPKPEAPVAKPEAPLPKPEMPVVKSEPPMPKQEPFKEREARPLAKAPVAPPATPAPAAELGLFGGKGLAKYHAAGCRFGERIGKNERVFFHSADAARQAGRVPCSICLSEETQHASAR